MLATAILALKLSTHRCARLWYAAEKDHVSYTLHGGLLSLLKLSTYRCIHLLEHSAESPCVLALHAMGFALVKLSTHRCARPWYSAERPRELHFTRWASKFDQVINPCIYLEHGAHVSNRHFAKVINPSLCPSFVCG
ncbi:hypothetical protein RRG08_063489 [Elysia crispata]|uniref:Uncharacterized protein n=1 Tax=Elysia crispata TaxID=231223 RepID=A0AAE0XW81_9GAST|nr:hypothetical protein RRG08_063489 [Elysia crispata]